MNVNAFLCEEVTEATYNRQNLFGANLSDKVAVPQFPYILHTTFFILLGVDLGESAKKIALEIFLKGVSVGKISIDGPRELGKKYNVRMAWSRLDIQLESEGGMELHCIIDGRKFVQSWDIEVGAAAYRATSGRLPTGGVIDARVTAESPFLALISEVKEHLFIADQYLTADFLRELMSKNAAHLQVSVLTGGKLRLEGAAQNLMQEFPNLEIRYDRLFHDRLVIRDFEEVYVFGASLKDLIHKRVSFFQRIFDAQQTQTTLKLADDCWKNAAPVLADAG